MSKFDIDDVDWFVGAKLKDPCPLEQCKHRTGIVVGSRVSVRQE
ncbi:hypothetical protein ACFPVT_05585 [Corynebacterium choanae]|nr:hypothetical protein [Corynebacterium choanae]